jgi:hypothetical protein
MTVTGIGYRLDTDESTPVVGGSHEQRSDMTE